MILVQSTVGSVLLMVLGMILLGCWPVVWKHIALRGRNFTHTFLDYCLTYAVIGAFTALTFGQLGPEISGQPNFIDQLQQKAVYILVPTAAFGGMCFMMADICVQYSVALLRLAIGPPILNAVVIIGSELKAAHTDTRAQVPERHVFVLLLFALCSSCYLLLNLFQCSVY